MKTPTSKTGLALTLTYLAITAACVALSFASHADQKGSFVFLQLPIALQLAGLDALGLGGLLSSLGWVGAYVVIGLPTLVGLYLLGSLVGAGAAALRDA